MRRPRFAMSDENPFDMNVGLISTEMTSLLANQSFGTGCPQTAWF